MPPRTRSDSFAAVLLAALFVVALAVAWTRASREDGRLTAVAACADREAGDVGAAAWREAWERCWDRREP